jgi:predicted DNA-binding transcriptional regulator AlpA
MIETKEEDRVIWRRDLCEKLQVTSKTIQRYMAAGKLPRPDVSLSQRTMGWKVSTLRAASIHVV